MKVLVDTSIWIHFFKHKEGKIVDNIVSLLQNDAIYICPPILQEILQGAKSETEYNKLKNYFTILRKVKVDSYQDAIEASNIFFELRKSGITIRKSYDCLIAYYALKENLLLYHADADFDLIAKKFPLKFHTN